MKKHIILFFITTMTLFCLLYGFQKQQKLFPPEKYEVKVRLVLVDVIVIKGGKFVTDLTKEDFELFEDDKKVPINSFELISFGKRELLTLEEEPEEVSPDIPRKQLVVLFDGVCSEQRNLKKGARKITDELVSLAKLGNEVMILQLSKQRGIEILQPFTTDEKLIRKAIIRASASLWFDRSLEALKMYQEMGIDGVGEMEQPERYLELSKTSLLKQASFFERGRFEKAVGGILSVANMIKDLPGRKTILFISDGLPAVYSRTLDSVIQDGTKSMITKYDTSQLDRKWDTGTVRVFDPSNILKKKKIMSGDEVFSELIRFVNAHNISIYTLDPDTFTRHLVPTTAEFAGEKKVKQYVALRTEKKLKQIQSLTWLAEDTGGVSLKGAKKYDRFYRVMSTDLNYYYQLSYYAPRKEPDNQYHKIKVKVKRSGVNVRFRKGYTDYTEEEEGKMRLVSAFYNPSLFRELPFKAELILFHKDSKKYEPWMNISLPARKLFIEGGVAYGPKKFNLHVWVKDKKRGESAFAGQMSISFNIDSKFMDVIKTTDFLAYHFKGGEIPFSQREYQAIFALYDDQTDEIGTWEQTISLPNFKEKKQGDIIACALGFQTPNPKKGREIFSISKKDGSLHYGQIKFFPSVTNQFHRMQDASVFLQVYLPQGKIEISPKFKISGKERLSQQIPAELVAESWNKKSKVWSGIFNLNLSTVIFGHYTLRVEIPISEEAAVQSKEIRFTKLQN